MKQVILVCVWHMYQPVNGIEEGWTQENIRGCYRPLAKLHQEMPEAKIGLNIQGVLLDQIYRIDPELPGWYAQLHKKGSIELLSSGFYHPILPLIPLDDMEAQIDLNQAMLEKMGVRAAGFWPPELAWTSSLVPILAEREFRWSLIDETTYLLGTSQGPWINEVRYPFGIAISHPVIKPEGNHDGIYQPYRAKVGSKALDILVRDARLSNWMEEDSGFKTGVKKPQAFVDYLDQIAQEYTGNGEPVVTIAVDGENFGGRGATETLGHYQRLLETVLTSGFIQMMTPSEALALATPREELFFPVGTWKGDLKVIWLASEENQIFLKQLDYLRERYQHLKLIADLTPGLTDDPDSLRQARQLILTLETSCWLYWHFSPREMREKAHQYLDELRCLLHRIETAYLKMGKLKEACES